jgi:cysteine synthase A
MIGARRPAIGVNLNRNEWVREAVRKIEADFRRSADTHLIPLSLPGFAGIDLYLKDESVHPTGSLKHRLARSLFLYAICNGWLHERSTIVEASSGSTAISEAYFARLLGLAFVAVMPRATSPEKIAAIEFYGGRCHLIEDPTRIYGESEALARELGGHYMDQFTYSERATDWRSNNNIAESIFDQMRHEPCPVPAWIVASAGTGGTTATIGRFVRYQRHPTRLLCPDPDHSVFFDFYRTGERGLTLERGSLIEGIGRPRVEASFLPDVIDEMVRVPDALAFGAMQYLYGRLGRRVGGSTGTNFVGALHAAARMRERGERGAIVTIICDRGERYVQSYYDAVWLRAHGFDLDGSLARVRAMADEGAPPGLAWCSRDAR